MNFSKGDRVIINPESQYQHQGYSDDIQLIGTIISTKTNYKDFMYLVDWEGGKHGLLYNDEDLFPFNSELNYEIY